MKTRIIHNCAWLRVFGIDGITFYPFVFVRHDGIIPHELIHVEQVKRTGFVRFYLSYVLEFFAHWISCGDRNRAYRSISWEREAYGGKT